MKIKLKTVATVETDADTFIERLLEIEALRDVPVADVRAYLESKTASELVTGSWDVMGRPPASSAFRDRYVIPIIPWWGNGFTESAFQNQEI